MSALHFSENLIKLRQKKKITQEQLADFVGVTKASVSKWETRQSLPDILLLPKLAAFFDITIDELLGYEPALGKEQIRKLYAQFAAAFAERPFEEVMEESCVLVKNYYSCYPFLFQICTLWLNHFMLAENDSRQREILLQISMLCGHILSDCKDIGICNDTIALKATVDLQLGNAPEVIDALEELLNPCRLLSQSDSLLIQAYRLSGDTKKADSFTQISMFLHLMSLAGSATHFLVLHADDLFACEATVSRMEAVFTAFRLNRLHPNIAAQFWYQAAIVFAENGSREKALEFLAQYASCIDCLFENGTALLHGDSYFCRIDSWFEQTISGPAAPRSKKLISDSAIAALTHPAFALLQQEEKFLRIKNSLTKKGEQF